MRHVWLLGLTLAACGSDTPTGPLQVGSGGSVVVTAVAVTCTAEATGHQCRASAQMADGSAQDVTAAATWTSSNTAVATVDGAGRVTHVGSGQAEIRATYQDRFGGVIVLVNVSVSSVTVTCTPEAGAHVCSALARLSNGVTQDVTRSGAVWSSSNTAIALVDSSGRVAHVGNGQVDISARFQSVVGGISLTLSGVVTLSSISVTCTPELEAHQCAAVAQFSDGTNQTVTSQAAWTSSNTTVATVDTLGRVRHRSSGQTDVRATYRNVTGSITLDVTIGAGTSVVINEFASRSNDGSTDDWVELRNDSGSPVDISGWSILEWNASVGVSVRFVAAAGIVLAPGCHYLVANRASVAGLARDARMDNINLAGGLALTRADGSIVDQVGYDPNSIYREGNTLPPMTIDDSRSYSRAGNDTNDNATDFILRTRTPLNSTSSCAVR